MNWKSDFKIVLLGDEIKTLHLHAYNRLGIQLLRTAIFCAVCKAQISRVH